MERFPPSNVDLQGVFGGFLQRNQIIGILKKTRSVLLVKI